MMKKQSTKYVVLAFFALVVVVSLILLGSVKINYNISDYLDESTETKISLNIMKDEFTSVGNIQVMVEDVTPEEAYEIGEIIKAIPNVLVVNFDETSEDYFKKNTENNGKTGDALFAVICSGDEYSETATQVHDDIKNTLEERFEDSTSYGGAVSEKISMRKTMRSEIVIILAVSVLFAYGIMLIMANSWLEPAFILLSSGVAVIINMGTNAMFGSISYITNAVAAILQLALSIDYSIVLLHNFRALKKEMPDKHEAMSKAVKITFKPVLASALTTVFGLLALVFMTMKIGADIGIVLTKGIIISMLTSLTLLPALLLVVDNLMQKTSKRDLVIRGKAFCKLAFKGGKAIALVALAVIIVCGGLSLQNTYSFTDAVNSKDKIAETFGTGNTIVVLYKHHGLENWDIEDEFKKELLDFKTSDGKTPFKNYTGYSNTVLEEYTIDKAAQKLHLSKGVVMSLFAMYHEQQNDPETKVLSPIDFVNFTVEYAAIDNYEHIDEATVHTLEKLSVIYDIISYSHTSDEMYKLVSTGVMADTGLNAFQVDQMYGLYFWDQINEGNTEVNFETILDFMAIDIANDEFGKSLMDEQTATDLLELSDGLEEFKAQMNADMTKEEFREFGKEKFGEDGWVQTACDLVFAVASGGGKTAKVVEILRLVDSVSYLIPEEYQAYIKNYTYVYDAIKEECSYEEFLPLVEKVVLALSNEERAVDVSQNSVQQGYIMYFNSIDAVPHEKINGYGFVEFVNETIASNDAVSGNVTEDSVQQLKDVAAVKEFIADTKGYNYKEITNLLNDLKKNVQSITSSNELSSSDVYFVYMGHAAQYEEGLRDPIIAENLLDFVDANKDGKLAQYMTSEMKSKIEDRKQAVENAKVLFRGEEYNRILVSVDLPNESADSSAFVDYIKQAAKAVGMESSIAGNMVSTCDLEESFETDNKIITVFTIVAIFLVIAFVFKSVSLPTILVAIIQGAIWIAMSTSLLTGDPIFFMSYIIATCILMGSTIDYGILMSTNYVQNRKTMDKKEALVNAVSSAMPTVFTSGLILTICGFVVGLIASLRSISTVGTLLGKGTLVSILMITVVLPSVLYALDGVILKLTYRKKTPEEKEVRKAKKEAKKAAKAEKKAAKKSK